MGSLGEWALGQLAIKKPVVIFIGAASTESWRQKPECKAREVRGCGWVEGGTVAVSPLKKSSSENLGSMDQTLASDGQTNQEEY